MTILPAFLSLGLMLANLGLFVPHRPDPASETVAKADALRQEDKNQEAVGVYDEAVRLDPGNVDAYLGRAAAHEGLHQAEAAGQDYALAIRAAPRSAKPWYTRGRSRTAANRNDEAISDFDTAIGLDPYHDELYLWRGDALLELDRAEAAVADLTRALALTCKGSDVVTSAYSSRCLAYRNLKQYEKALADNESAAQAGFDDQEERATCLAGLKRFEEALAVYDRRLTPSEPEYAPEENRPRILRQRARIRVTMQDFPGAGADLAEAAKLLTHPTTVDEGNMAWEWVLARRPVEAQAAARRAIANGDAEGWIHLNLADACLLGGNFDEAKEIYLAYVNEQVISGRTGLRVIRQDFADMRELGIDLPAMKAIEALLPGAVGPPPAAKAKPTPGN